MSSHPRSLDSTSSISPYESDIRNSNDENESYYPLGLKRTAESKGSTITRIKSNRSELSRVLTAIQDDHAQDEEEYARYREGNLISDVASEGDMTSSRMCAADMLDEEPTNSKDYNAKEVEEEDIMDKGYAWVIAVSCMLAMLSTWGVNAGYGVFLNFYLTDNVFPGSTSYDFALIGGIVLFISQFFAPFAVLVVKVFGVRSVCATGSILQFLGYLLASFSTKLWQIYLTEGVLVGVGFVLIFIPATIVLPTYFRKYRAFAFGISHIGIGTGGIIYSLSVNKLIQDTGDQRWALRMCAISTFVISMTATLLIRQKKVAKLPFKTTLSREFIWQNTKSAFNFSYFREYPLVLLSAWYSVLLVGYTLMVFSLSSYAQSCGLSSHQGSIITSVFNAGQAFGRPSMGFAGDRIGRNNLSTLITLLITILMFAFWINADSFGSLIAFAILLGLIIGVGSLMSQPLASDIIESPAGLPAVWSGINIIVSFFCLVAEVIALALRNEGSNRPYLHTQLFSGSCFAAGFLALLCNREWLVRRTIKRRLELAISKYEEISQMGEENSDLIETESRTVLKHRVTRYRFLLKATVRCFFVRMLYPIRV